jgi:hypothetical protein
MERKYDGLEASSPTASEARAPDVVTSYVTSDLYLGLLDLQQAHTQYSVVVGSDRSRAAAVAVR